MDEEGNLYYSAMNTIGMTTYLIDGEEKELASTEENIIVVDPKGNIIDSFPASLVGKIILIDSKIYHIIQNNSNEFWLEEFDKKT